MKLFSSIAAAVVIGGSFLIPNPAEAQSKWSKVYPESQNYITYVKGMTRRGNTVDYTRKVYNKNTRETWTDPSQAHCGDLATRFRHEDGEWSDWIEILPETAGGNELAFVCRNAG